jgi:hypothetical protein
MTVAHGKRRAKSKSEQPPAREAWMLDILYKWVRSIRTIVDQGGAAFGPPDAHGKTWANGLFSTRRAGDPVERYERIRNMIAIGEIRNEEQR